MKEKWLQNKDLYRKIWIITLPIIVQNLLSAAVNSADVLMLNYVGQDALAASSLATQYGSIAFMAFYGIGSGVTMLSAQYWGKGDVNTTEEHRLQLKNAFFCHFCCDFSTGRNQYTGTVDESIHE